MNEIVVRNSGNNRVTRRGGSASSNLASLANTLSNSGLQKMVRDYVKGTIKNLSKSSPPSKLPRESRQTLVVQDIPMPISKGFEITRRAPVTRPTKGGGIRVANREVLSTSVDASSPDWTLSDLYKFEINPGLSKTFPWLSTVAKNYTEYRVHSLQFHWVPSCPTTCSGDVIMTPLYDPQIPSPSSEVEASDQLDTRVGSVYIPHNMVMKPNKMNISGSRKLIRDYAMSGSVLNYDAGRFCLSTTSGSVGASGKLFVSYDIELFVPRLVRVTSLTGWPDNFVSYTLSAPYTISSGSTLELGSYVNYITPAQNLLDVKVSAVTGRFSAPYGMYRVDYDVTVYVSAAATVTTLVSAVNAGTSTPMGSYDQTTAASAFHKQHKGYFIWNNTPQGTGTVNSLGVQFSATTSAGTLSLAAAQSGTSITGVRFTLL